MKKVIYIFLAFLFALPLGAAAQKRAQKSAAATPEQLPVKISGKVVDSAGVPVSGAVVTSMEGRYRILTAADGSFGAMSGAADYMLVEAPGFRPQTVFVPDLGDTGGLITLKTTPVGEELITVAYGKFASERIAGAVSNIRMDEVRNKYSSVNFWPLLPALMTGMISNSLVRGLSGSVVVIDGLVRDGRDASSALSSMITAEEIKEITVLKDAASRMLYGASANTPIIMITTRRGEAFKREINLTYDFGIGVPISYPSYLKAADYMILRNEALRNDGKPAVYSYDDIENTRAGIDPVKYPDVDYYGTNEFLHNYKPTNRVNAEFIGGNALAQYYLNMGYHNTRSLLKAGEGANQQTNIFNVKGAVDVKLTDFVKVGLDGTAIFSAYNGPKYQDRNFWNLTTSQRVNAYPLLIPIDRVRGDNAAIIEEAVAKGALIDGEYLLGGSSTFKQNIYGDLNLGGYDKTMTRFMNVNLSVDVDLKSITKGLGFKSVFGSDNFSYYQIQQSNKYAVYAASVAGDGSIGLVKEGVDEFTGTQGMPAAVYYRLLGWSNHLYYDRVSGRHDLKASLTSLLSSYKLSGIRYGYRTMNFGARANYVFDRRYVAEYSGAYIGSQYLAPDHRWGYAQSLAAGWIVSNTEFAKNVGFLDYLKVKASYANTKSDPLSSTFHAFENTYATGGAYNYGGGARSNNVMTVTTGNPDLSWVRSHDINAGFEALVLGNALWIEAAYFNVLSYDRAVSNSLNNPGYLGGSNFAYYVNYGKVRFDGIEAGLKGMYKIGSFDFNIGLNAVFTRSRILQNIEINYGPGMEYFQNEGKPYYAKWGLQSEGFYTQEQIDRINAGDPSIARSSYGVVRAGDIKYTDMNNDGVIDDYDRIVIGNSRPDAVYSLTLDISWKDLNLFANLTAQTGASGTVNELNQNYYWTYGGEMKYPSHMVGRWAYDPSYGLDTRATATYPRLTDSESQNNFRSSTFWKYDASYITMPLLQMTYTMPQGVARALNMKKTMVFVRGHNLFTIGPDVDKLELNIGSEPQLRWYYIGAKFEF